MESQPAESRISILREEPAWLVVAKPTALHTVAQRGSDAPTVEAWLRAERPELATLEEAGLVHRLDRDTSGCLIVAKDAETRTRLREAFSGRGGEVRKTYLALVEGAASDGEFRLSFASRHRGSAKVTVRPEGEPETIGRCRWRVRSSRSSSSAGGAGGKTRTRGVSMREPPRDSPSGPSAEPPTTLLEVELLGPGRRHQIRAGLASLGHPLVGDVLYGARAEGAPRLHAWRVEVDGVPVEAEPPSWAAVAGRAARR